jgi:excisionase family DNA binding protein
VNLTTEEVNLLTIDEVAQLLRVSRHTVYRLVGSGEIPGRKIGRNWRFVDDELVTYLRRERDAGPTKARSVVEKAAGSSP